MVLKRQYIIIALIGLSIVLALWLRAYVAFRSPQAINVDEQYYLSAAAVGAEGLGLFPYLRGSPPITISPVNGYVIYLYVFAYQVLGASIFSVRLVTFIAAILTLPGMYMLIKLLYGRAAALLGVAILPWVFFYVISNSARMDAVTIAFVTWALFIVMYALDKKKGFRWHLGVGLLWGIGLQVHLNTPIVAFACGLLYLVDYISRARENGAWININTPVVAYVLGYLIGAVGFLIFNYLPDPDTFMSILEKIRIWDNELRASGLTAEERTSSLLKTLTSPDILYRREQFRFRSLFLDAPPFESLMTILGIIALTTRRTWSDVRVLILIVGTVIAGVVIFVNESYFYLMHLLPIFFLPIPALFLYGFRGKSPQLPRLEISVFLVGAFTASSFFTFTEAVGLRDVAQVEEPIYVRHVHELASPDHVIAGPAPDFVPYFAAYPRYLALEGTEQTIAMILNDVEAAQDYWTLKQPDFVFGFITEETIGYFTEMGYVPVAPAVWAGPQLWYENPDFENPVAAFDGQLLVPGITTDKAAVQPCEQVSIHSWWQTTQENVSSDFSASIYLTDSDGTVIAQADGPPADRVLGTWSPFEYNSDIRTLTIPCETPPGEYDLMLAVYHYATLDRLSAFNGDETPSGDAVRALTITVE